MAALAAVKGLGESSYPSDLSWVSGPDDNDPEVAKAAAQRAFQSAKLTRHILQNAGFGGYRRW
jgi:hypothetical protein